jgi:hypothetical protein
MYDHPGRLVHYKQVIVFVNYVKRDVFRQDFHPTAPVGHHETDDISGPYDQVGLGHLFSYPDIAFLDRTLDTMPGSVFQVRGHELIDAHRSLAGIDVQAKMLEHSLFFILKSFFGFVKEPFLVHG